MCLNCGCMRAHDDMGKPGVNITYEDVKRAADANDKSGATLEMIARAADKSGATIRTNIPRRGREMRGTRPTGPRTRRHPTAGQTRGVE